MQYFRNPKCHFGVQIIPFSVDAFTNRILLSHFDSAVEYTGSLFAAAAKANKKITSNKRDKEIVRTTIRASERNFYLTISLFFIYISLDEHIFKTFTSKSKTKTENASVGVQRSHKNSSAPSCVCVHHGQRIHAHAQLITAYSSIPVVLESSESFWRFCRPHANTTTQRNPSWLCARIRFLRFSNFYF